MKIRNYLETKNVTPEELENYFERIKDFEIIGTINPSCCYNCDAFYGVERLRVGSLLYGQFCRNCISINIIYPNVLGSGVSRVSVYTESQA